MSRLDWCKSILLNRDCYDWKNDNCDGCNIFKAYCEGARRAKNSIVRCKECRHKVTTKDGEYNPEDIVCDYWATDGLEETDFCSYGERKGGGDE